MDNQSTCASCGAQLAEGETCETHFHQMLFWEAEYPAYGAEVHHYLVLCYHLQHPHLYSMEGLAYGKGLLVQFFVDGLSPQEVRKRSKEQVAGGNRDWKVTARPDSIGVYTNPVTWTMTARDVVAGGVHHYVENTRAWAKAIYEDLKASDNL